MADTPVKGPLAFTASNGTTLVSYDADFVQLNGGAGYVGITSNMLTMLFADNTTDFAYREGTGTYSADQYVSATLNDTPAGGARAMFILRASADTGANRDYYLIRLDGSTTVERWNNGSMTSLGTPSITWAAGDVAKFRAITNGANCDIVCVKNGATQATISDTSPLSGGNPGICLSMSSAGFMSLDSLELGDSTASAPSLTSPVGNATGNTTSTVGFTTDQAVSVSLPAYFLTLPAATAAPASAAALIADGATVSQTTGSTTPTRALTGLTAGTAYRTHMCQPGSNVVSSASYTPSALSAAGSIATQGGVQGDAFVWTGALPNTFFSGGIGTKTIACTGLGASGLTVVNTTTGVLGGTQGTPGTYNLTFTQTDSSTAGTNPNGGGSPPQTATRTATLVITATGSAPTVNTNPTNLTVADGATASFTGSFDGSPIPSLQWQEFIGGVWTAMSGEVANVLALGVVDVLDTGRIFRISGTNVNGGPVYSSSATLTVTGAAVGTVTSDVFADWADDTPLASLTIEFVVLIDVATGASVLELTNQVTDTAGILTITDAALTAGDDYMLAVFNADGSICGIKAYTAT